MYLSNRRRDVRVYFHHLMNESDLLTYCMYTYVRYVRSLTAVGGNFHD